MKGRRSNLAALYQKAFNYWFQTVPGHPRNKILCKFDEFWVWDFDNQLYAPMDYVKLEELPQKFGPLAFLFPEKATPVFGNDHQVVTRKSAVLA